MNRFTEFPINTAKARKLFTLSMLLLCFLPVLLDTVVITPLYVMLEANVAFSGGFLTMAIYYFKDLISIFAFSSAYAVIIFSVFFLTRKTARFVILLYTLIFLVQIPLKLVMNIFIYGSLGSVTDIAMDLVYLFIYFLLYMLQLLFVYFFAATDTNKYLRYVEFTKSKKSKKRKQAETEAKKLSYVLPLSKIFDRLNPLQRSALKMSILVFAIKIFSRLLNDISYGAPTSFGEVLVMIVYYLSDIIYGAVAYLIALLVFSFLYEKLKEKTDEAEASSAENDNISVLED